MSHRQPADEGLLFDLPLERTPAEPAARQVDGPESEAVHPPEQPPLPLAIEEETPDPTAGVLLDPPEGDSVATDKRPVAKPPGNAEPAAVTLKQRAAAGLTDLGVCAAVMVVLLVALLAQGVRPQLPDWPAGVLFLLTFSFLYAVLPLAFWGRTPGMALVALRSSSTAGQPLTFRQAVLKWLGLVLTVAFAGLPLLLAPGGRSLSDRISGSVTRLRNRS